MPLPTNDSENDIMLYIYIVLVYPCIFVTYASVYVNICWCENNIMSSEIIRLNTHLTSENYNVYNMHSVQKPNKHIEK